jgi:hypothetical protein
MAEDQSLTEAEREELELPDVLPGHWDTPDGREMAERYARMTREKLGNSKHSDLAMANAIFMVGREDLELIGLQTAAKERIRWLSVQLAIANARLASSPRLREALSGLFDNLELLAPLERLPDDDLALISIGKLKRAKAALALLPPPQEAP